MEKLFKQLSSYNLLNNLLPGIVFAVIAQHISCWTFLTERTILDLFICYFYGLVISRIGSLIVEPCLSRLLDRNYPRYLKAKDIDKDIPLLSEVNNTYRTMIALVLCCGLSHLAYKLIDCCSCMKTIIEYGVFISLIPLFIWSFIKQNGYINRRIDNALSQKENEK